MTDKNFLEQQIMLLHNAESHIENLRKRMFILTGCREFGTVDGMNGTCIDCYYENNELFKKCEKFKFDNLSKI